MHVHTKLQFYFYFVHSFSRVQFALSTQIGQDARFTIDNYLFFMSGNETGKVNKHICVECDVYY